MSFYFLSDLHIGSISDCQRVNLLLDDMQKDPDLKGIFFVGDLFEFNLGYRFTLFTDHFLFLSKIKALIDQGIDIHFFSGNHDPSLSSFYQALGIHCHLHPIRLSLYSPMHLPYHIHIEHGDLQEEGLIKSAFCKFVRLPWVNQLAQMLPISLLYTITQRVKQSKRYQSPKLEDQQINRLWQQLSQQGEHAWIMGHFHRLISLCSPMAQRLFVLGDGIEYLSFLELKLPEQPLSLCIFDKVTKQITFERQISFDSSSWQSKQTKSQHSLSSINETMLTPEKKEALTAIPILFTLFRLQQNQRVEIGLGDHDF